jgi:hypothetical protein
LDRNDYNVFALFIIKVFSIRQYLCWGAVLTALIFMMVASVPTADAADDQVAPRADFSIGDLENGVTVIYLGLWVVNVYDFDYPSGSYVFDYYIYFYWSDPNITTVNLFMMNGCPATPATKELVDSGVENGEHYEFYRVRASLSYPLEAGNYPFEDVALPISIEVVDFGRPIELRWLENKSGVDPGFKIVGWKVTDVVYSITLHDYPFETNANQATMDIIIDREMIVATPQLIIPPIIFCLVSAFSFLFRMDDEGAFGLRAGLNTSMLITAVLFNLSEQDKLPPTSTVNFYTIFITGVFIFLAINLVVTILGYVQFNYHKDPVRLKMINRYGIMLSIIVPVIVILVIIFAII